MIKATAQEQGLGADVGPRTLRARNNFTNALQGVIDEAEKYNQTGIYREDISTGLLEKLQDSMNADFFKLVGTEEGQALLDQVDQMGINLSQENIDFINKHTGVVDILYGNYDTDLAMAKKGQGNSSASNSGTNTNSNTKVDDRQTSIDSLSGLRDAQPIGSKAMFSKTIITYQKNMIKEFAQEQGWGTEIRTETVEAKDNFFDALQGVVDEAERYNRTGVYREDISTGLLEKLQDSMNADLLKLVGTEEGQNFLNQIDSMTGNLSQENIDFINKHTGVVDILYGNYDADLAIGEENKARTPLPIAPTDPNKPIEADLSLTSAQKNNVTELLIDRGVEAILGGTDVGDIDGHNNLENLISKIADILGEAYTAGDSSSFTGVSGEIYNNYKDSQHFNSSGQAISLPIESIYAMIQSVADMPGGPVTQAYNTAKLNDSLDLLSLSIDDLNGRRANPDGRELRFALDYEINKLDSARDFLKGFSTEPR